MTTVSKPNTRRPAVRVCSTEDVYSLLERRWKSTIRFPSNSRICSEIRNEKSRPVGRLRFALRTQRRLPLTQRPRAPAHNKGQEQAGQDNNQNVGDFHHCADLSIVKLMKLYTNFPDLSNPVEQARFFVASLLRMTAGKGVNQDAITLTLRSLLGNLTHGEPGTRFLALTKRRKRRETQSLALVYHALAQWDLTATLRLPYERNMTRSSTRGCAASAPWDRD
jgi:hypothetical protein